MQEQVVIQDNAITAVLINTFDYAGIRTSAPGHASWLRDLYQSYAGGPDGSDRAVGCLRIVTRITKKSGLLQRALEDSYLPSFLRRRGHVGWTRATLASVKAVPLSVPPSQGPVASVKAVPLSVPPTQPGAE